MVTVTEVASSALSMRGVSKRFGGTVALQDVDLTVDPGSIHALVGENGAGKTTLMHVLAGLYRPDSGTVLVDGATVALGDPIASVNAGVGIVHQHVELVGPLTALENVALGEGKRSFRIDLDRHRALAQAQADRLGFVIDWDRAVEDLEVGAQQRVEILRILHGGASILVLDEPTTHLAPSEVDQLFAAMRALANDGLTVIIIAHKPREVLAVSDAITVLRKGCSVARLVTAETDADVLVEHVLGSASRATLDALPRRSERVGSGEIVLQARRITATSPETASRIEDVDLRVVAGAIVGVAGVTGNGQVALVEALSGIIPLSSGTLDLGGKDISRTDAAGRIRQGLVTLAADRLTEGILRSAPVWETFALGRHLHLSWRWRPGRLRNEARGMIEHFQVVAPGPDAPTGNLSGGNIQRILVARVLALASAHERAALVAANPTAGLDVGASRFVHDQLRNLRDAGNAVLVVSEDRDELAELCDEIVVLSRGQIVGHHVGPEFDIDLIGSEMLL